MGILDAAPPRLQNKINIQTAIDQVITIPLRLFKGDFFDVNFSVVIAWLADNEEEKNRSWKCFLITSCENYP